MAKVFSTRAMGRELGLSQALVARLARAGMPMDDPAKAREWRALYVRSRARPEHGRGSSSRDDDHHGDRGDHLSGGKISDVPNTQRGNASIPLNVVDLFSHEAGEGQLEDTIPRLRRLEKATALALERAIKDDNHVAAVSLRREHCTALRTLYASEEKLLKIDEAKGKLIRLDRALAMIDEALKEPVIMLRQLPDLARSPEEKSRLEVFLHAILGAMRDGAARGFADPPGKPEAMTS